MSDEQDARPASAAVGSIVVLTGTLSPLIF